TGFQLSIFVFISVFKILLKGDGIAEEWLHSLINFSPVVVTAISIQKWLSRSFQKLSRREEENPRITKVLGFLFLFRDEFDVGAYSLSRLAFFSSSSRRLER